MGQTEHIGLYQWEWMDGCRREGLNENFLKIDTRFQQLAEQLTGGLAKTCRMTCGRYSGTNSSNRLISLAFTPAAVFIETMPGHRPEGGGNHLTGGIVLSNSPIKEMSRSVQGAFITVNGFYVTTQDTCNLNGSNYTYHYVAFA